MLSSVTNVYLKMSTRVIMLSLGTEVEFFRVWAKFWNVNIANTCARQEPDQIIALQGLSEVKI